MDNKSDGLKNNSDQFVIFLSNCKPPTYKKDELVLGKKVSDIKVNLKLKKDYTLAIRTPTFIQYADPFVIVTDDFPNLIHHKRFDFAYAIQIINIDEINSIKFIFQCEVDNILPGSENTIQMPCFLVQFYYDEFYKKAGIDVLNKIVSSFGLPIENPQLFINQNNVDFNKVVAMELFKKLRFDKNSNVFKCHLTEKAIEFMEKRVTIIQELIKTETIYLERLNYLFNSFIGRVKSVGIFDSKIEKYQEFKDCLHKIFKYQTNFFLEIKSLNVGYDTQISKVFLKLGDGFSINQDLVRQYAKLQILMEEIKTSGKLINAEISVFSTEKIDIKQISEIPFHPLTYINTIQKIREVTPKSHIDYDFLCMAEVKMMTFCSDIDASYCKLKNSFEMINLINRIDESENSVCLNGQSLKSIYEISIRNLKKPGCLYLFNNKILLTAKNGFGKSFKETVYLFNKIKNQSFILSSDSKNESIIFIKDEGTNYTVNFESREKRNEFIFELRNIRKNLLFQKSGQIFSEEVILNGFGENIPPQISCHSACPLSDKSIIFTGGTTEGKKEHCSPFIIFNSRDNEASIDSDFLTPSPNMKLAFERNQINGKVVISLFLFGGKKNRSVWTYGKKAWIQMPCEANFTRVRHSIVSFNGSLFIFGGLDEQNKPTNDLFIYNISKHEWSNPIFKGQIPLPRIDHSAVVYKNMMIIHGGRFNDSKICDTWFFDFNKMMWIQPTLSKCSPLVPRSGHVAVIVNHFMIILGGEGYCNLPFALNIETLKILKLKLVGNYVYGINNFAAAVISNYNNVDDKQIICFGGFNADNSIVISAFMRLYLPDEILRHDDQIQSKDDICI